MVPEVKIKTARSVIVAFAAGVITDGTGRSADLRKVIDGSSGTDTLSNENKFKVKWRVEPGTN